MPQVVIPAEEVLRLLLNRAARKATADGLPWAPLLGQLAQVRLDFQFDALGALVQVIVDIGDAPVLNPRGKRPEA